MPKSSAKTVKAYLLELPEERRTAISAVREVILKHLPKGYEECMIYGMIGYVVPFERYPNTYNKLPLTIAALGSQKNYMVVHLMSAYGNTEIAEWFVNEYKASGKKLDMGQACVRFKKLDDLPLDLVGKVIAKVSVEKYIEFCENMRKPK